MTRERWTELMDDPDAVLADAELDAGWHWCWDWDGLLVGPDMTMEMSCCTCEWVSVQRPDYTPIEFSTGPVGDF